MGNRKKTVKRCLKASEKAQEERARKANENLLKALRNENEKSYFFMEFQKIIFFHGIRLETHKNSLIKIFSLN